MNFKNFSTFRPYKHYLPNLSHILRPLFGLGFSLLPPLPTLFKCISKFCIKTLWNILRVFSVVIVISVLSFNHSVWNTQGQDRTISHHCSIFLPSLATSPAHAYLAQAAKQATAARFIFSPNRLRLPFNAWFSTEWALWNVHHTNTVETNYGPLSAWSCLSYRHACSPSILIISALWFSSSGRW